MKYQVYQLEFPNGVRFGSGNLDSTETTFHSDTLFSALFQEALHFGEEENLLRTVRDGGLLFSDAFPYIDGEYYVPRPMVSLEIKEEDQGDSKEKKKFKDLRYVPIQYLDDYVAGEFPKERLEDMKRLGKHDIKVSVNIRAEEEPQPYRVKAFRFQEGNGLYVIVGYVDEKARNLIIKLFDSLQYTGLGGKRSAGLGRFRCREMKLPPELEERLNRNGGTRMLLSTAIPADEELSQVVQGSEYSLLKRSGFVHSATYAQSPMRKRDLYVFSPGSCFRCDFPGKLIEERNSGGSHSVFRYEKGFFMGV